MYTIKEASEMVGLTVHSIRYYTDKELIPSIERDKNNNRLFDQNSINWLMGIQNLRTCGMSIEAIKDYVNLCLEGDSTVEKRYEILLDQKKEVDMKLEEYKKMSEYLEKKSKLYQDIMNKKIADPTNPDTW